MNPTCVFAEHFDRNWSIWSEKNEYCHVCEVVTYFILTRKTSLGKRMRLHTGFVAANAFVNEEIQSLIK